MPGEMELKPGEIVFFPPWKQSLSENPASPHPLPLSLPHPLLSISSSEGSEVITKPRWRVLPCLRPCSPSEAVWSPSTFLGVWAAQRAVLSPLRNGPWVPSLRPLLAVT